MPCLVPHTPPRDLQGQSPGGVHPGKAGGGHISSSLRLGQGQGVSPGQTLGPGSGAGVVATGCEIESERMWEAEGWVCHLQRPEP